MVVNVQVNEDIKSAVYVPKNVNLSDTVIMEKRFFLVVGIVLLSILYDN